MQVPGIDKQKSDSLKHWFTDYVNGFDLKNTSWQQNITLKEQHSIRVSKEISLLGEKLKLKDNALRFVEVMGLFHDIGRFEQYARYRTFADSRSENHAVLGVNILEKLKVLEMLDDSVRQVMLRSILYHNRAKLPDEEDSQVLYCSKLLRDADKLDIFRVVTDYYHRPDSRRNEAIELDLPDTDGFSEEVYEDLIHQQIVDIRNVKNCNDFKLLQIGWVFDINFQPTLDLIKEREYLLLIRQALPESRRITQLFDTIRQFEEGRKDHY